MKPAQVLAVFAHPDDESLVAGGTLAACAASGCKVSLLCMTRGERGSLHDDAESDPAALGDRRESELHAAAAILGITGVECLTYPDGGLRWIDGEALQSTIAERIRRLCPDVVITFGPEGLYWHKDHIAVHRATVAALATVEDEDLRPAVYFATWPEGRLSALVAEMTARALPADVWGLRPGDFGAPPATITTVLDVRAFAATRLRALRTHDSQFDQGHLFSALPNDLIDEFFGFEYFSRWDSRPYGWTWPPTLTVLDSIPTRGLPCAFLS